MKLILVVSLLIIDFDELNRLENTVKRQDISAKFCVVFVSFEQKVGIITLSSTLSVWELKLSKPEYAEGHSWLCGFWLSSNNWSKY